MANHDERIEEIIEEVDMLRTMDEEGLDYHGERYVAAEDIDQLCIKRQIRSVRIVVERIKKGLDLFEGTGIWKVIEDEAQRFEKEAKDVTRDKG